MKKAYLIKVDPTGNNNKYYEMSESGGQLVAKYGRVGYNPQKRTYPISQWNKKYNEKIRKGYVDHTPLVQTTNNSTLIGSDLSIKFLEELKSLSKQSFQQNYTIDPTSITQAKIDKVQANLNRMMNCKTTICFNELLVDIFTIFPRQMRRVDEHVAITNNDFARIIGQEQDNVDVLSGQIIKKSTTTKDQQTIKEAYGIDIIPVTKKEEQYLKSLMKGSKDRYVEAYKVVNSKTEEKFNTFVKSSGNSKRLDLFHGSRNQNWWSIANGGLILRPTNAVITGKMFGWATYFANKAQKSMGYCSNRGSYWAKGDQDFGILAVYDVHVGNQWEISRWKAEYKTLTEEKLKRYGPYDSVYAKGGADLRNDELMVYNENQTTIKYLIKFK